ncbi:hypothetical protein [Streptomyces vinaceus]|uniref:hypothetical protein n=1 Tax=Streptomyces vinaceus TaxID=1960 RepID=UPI003695AA8A
MPETADENPRTVTPRRGLTPFDTTVMVVGIGIGILETPSLVARHSADDTDFVLM